MTLIVENLSIKECNSAMNEDVYLLHFALSWEEHEKMCAADTSEIFKDVPTHTPSERRNSSEKSLQESEDTFQSILEEEEVTMQMRDQEATVENHDLINKECSFTQDQIETMCAADASEIFKDVPTPSETRGNFEKSLQESECTGQSIDSYQQKVPTRFPRVHLEGINECHLCKKKFRVKPDLRNHLDKVHSSEIFKDVPTHTPSERRNSSEKSLQESEDTFQSILEEEEVTMQMRDQATVENHDLINKECSFIQDQKETRELLNEGRIIKEELNMAQIYDSINKESYNHGSQTQFINGSCHSIVPHNGDTEQENVKIYCPMNTDKYDIKSEVLDDSLIQPLYLTNIPSLSLPHDRNSSQFSKAQPIWPVIKSSFSIVSNSSIQPNREKNLDLPLMNNSIEQSSQNTKTKLQNIAVPGVHGTEILPSLPLATDKVATQQRQNCNKPNEDENLKLPSEMNNSITQSSLNSKLITSNTLLKLNYRHGTEILPPLPPGADRVATQQEHNSDTSPGSALSKYPFLIVKTAENKLNFHKCKKISNQQKTLTGNLRAHLDYANECHICKQTFRMKNDLRNHLDKEHSYREFCCEQCGKRFKASRYLRRHLLRHSTKRHFKCKLCDKTFKNEGTLRIHLDKEHSYREFCCEQCDKRFKTSRDLRKHLQTHATERHFKCPLCDKTFTQKSALSSHMFVHTKNSKHFCVPCDKYFMTNSLLQIHIKMQHTAERPFKCSICNKGFVTYNGLKRHLLVHSEERPHQCSICKKSYKLRYRLKTHELTHKGIEKTVPCDFCDKMFVTTSLMIQHCRHVHWEKEFKCEKCGREFVRESELKEHQHQHNGEKPYKCETCGKCFARKDYLSVHKADHLNEKAWKCEKCNKAFKRNDHLQKHMLTHSDNKPFECDICKKTFNRKYNLKMHNKVHTDEYVQKADIRKKVADQRNKKRKIKKGDNTDDEDIEETSEVPRVKRSRRKKNVVSYNEENEDELEF